MKKFYSFAEFIDFGIVCYTHVSETCQKLFDNTMSDSFVTSSITKNELKEICGAPLKMFNETTRFFYEEPHDDFIRELWGPEKGSYHAYSNAKILARTIQKSYFANQISRAYVSANQMLPYSELAIIHCDIQPTPIGKTECQKEMYALGRQAGFECNGYIEFNHGEFPSGASKVSGNFVLLFLGTRMLTKAAYSIYEYFGSSNTENLEFEPDIKTEKLKIA